MECVLTCPQCGRAFSVECAAHARRRRYCSYDCANAALRSRVEKVCEACGAAFTVKPSQASRIRFCSRACYYANHRTVIRCAYCGETVTVKRYRAAEGVSHCGNRCATLHRMQDGFDPGYVGRKKHSGYRTDIETLAERALLSFGVPYVFEQKVGRYYVDFVLPTLGVALECDGWQHLTAAGRERDARRDVYLTARGLRVLHVPDRELRAEPALAVAAALGLCAYALSDNAAATAA